MATFFSFVAIVLGVALGMAVQAVHEAALTEFGRGLRTLAGDADLLVVGPRGGFDESLYAQLASRAEVAGASPLLELEARRAGSDETLQLLGVDVFALARVTPRLLPRPAAGAGRFATLADDSIFLGAAAQEALGLKPGDRITLQSGSGTTNLKVAGDNQGAAEKRRLAVMDIAAVQSLFARIGRLTRIDLKLAEGVAPAAARSALQAILPAGVLIEAPEAAADQAANLSRAYRVNLTMLAAIALLIGAGAVGGQASERVRLPARAGPAPSQPVRLAGGGGRPGRAGRWRRRRRPWPRAGVGGAGPARRRPGSRVLCRT
jgi:putative ABC transport system permease protein